MHANYNYASYYDHNYVHKHTYCRYMYMYAWINFDDLAFIS